MTLAYRYGAIISKSEKTEIKRANHVLQTCFRDFSSDPAVPVKQKILHAAMIRFPSLYRAFRIKNDPSLKVWEKKIRKKTQN